MTSAKASIDLRVPPDEVWRLIGGFGSLRDWMPYIPKISLSDGGRVRHLETADGQNIVERLEKYDLKERNYTYSILQAPFPVTDYQATIAVTAIDGDRGSHVEWAATFVPNGVSDDDALGLFQSIFSTGLQALASLYKQSKEIRPNSS